MIAASLNESMALRLAKMVQCAVRLEAKGIHVVDERNTRMSYDRGVLHCGRAGSQRVKLLGEFCIYHPLYLQLQVLLRTGPHPRVEDSASDWGVGGVEGVHHGLQASDKQRPRLRCEKAGSP
jgi:hypothetical protein